MRAQKCVISILIAKDLQEGKLLAIYTWIQMIANPYQAITISAGRENQVRSLKMNLQETIPPSMKVVGKGIGFSVFSHPKS
jgi:hypothetical protein